MNKRSVGSFYEEAVSAYLKEKGVQIIEKNFRCRMGEIDLIGIDGDTLVFFEIKYRKNNLYGSPLEAVDYRKQKKIISVAKYYLTYKDVDKYIRFDVIGVCDNEIEWIKDAFCM